VRANDLDQALPAKSATVPIKLDEKPACSCRSIRQQPAAPAVN